MQMSLGTKGQPFSFKCLKIRTSFQNRISRLGPVNVFRIWPLPVRSTKALLVFLSGVMKLMRWGTESKDSITMTSTVDK